MEQSLAAQVRELQARLQKETEANQELQAQLLREAEERKKETEANQELQAQLRREAEESQKREQELIKVISQLSTAFETKWTTENKDTLRSIFENLRDTRSQLASLEAEREIRIKGFKFEFGSEIRLQSKARFFREPNSPKFGDKFCQSSSSKRRK